MNKTEILNQHAYCINSSSKNVNLYLHYLLGFSISRMHNPNTSITISKADSIKSWMKNLNQSELSLLFRFKLDRLKESNILQTFLTNLVTSKNKVLWLIREFNNNIPINNSKASKIPRISKFSSNCICSNSCLLIRDLMLEWEIFNKILELKLLNKMLITNDFIDESQRYLILEPSIEMFDLFLSLLNPNIFNSPSSNFNTSLDMFPIFTFGQFISSEFLSQIVGAFQMHRNCNQSSISHTVKASENIVSPLPSDYYENLVAAVVNDKNNWLNYVKSISKTLIELSKTVQKNLECILTTSRTRMFQISLNEKLVTLKSSKEFLCIWFFNYIFENNRKFNANDTSIVDNILCVSILNLWTPIHEFQSVLLKTLLAVGSDILSNKLISEVFCGDSKCSDEKKKSAQDKKNKKKRYRQNKKLLKNSSTSDDLASNTITTVDNDHESDSISNLIALSQLRENDSLTMKSNIYDKHDSRVEGLVLDCCYPLQSSLDVIESLSEYQSHDLVTIVPSQASDAYDSLETNARHIQESIIELPELWLSSVLVEVCNMSPGNCEINIDSQTSNQIISSECSHSIVTATIDEASVSNACVDSISLQSSIIVNTVSLDHLALAHINVQTPNVNGNYDISSISCQESSPILSTKVESTNIFCENNCDFSNGNIAHIMNIDTFQNSFDEEEYNNSFHDTSYDEITVNTDHDISESDENLKLNSTSSPSSFECILSIKFLLSEVSRIILVNKLALSQSIINDLTYQKTSTAPQVTYPSNLPIYNVHHSSQHSTHLPNQHSTSHPMSQQYNSPTPILNNILAGRRYYDDITQSYNISSNSADTSFSNNYLHRFPRIRDYDTRKLALTTSSASVNPNTHQNSFSVFPAIISPLSMTNTTSNPNFYLSNDRLSSKGSSFVPVLDGNYSMDAMSEDGDVSHNQLISRLRCTSISMENNYSMINSGTVRALLPLQPLGYYQPVPSDVMPVASTFAEMSHIIKNPDQNSTVNNCVSNNENNNERSSVNPVQIDCLGNASRCNSPQAMPLNQSLKSTTSHFIATTSILSKEILNFVHLIDQNESNLQR